MTADRRPLPVPIRSVSEPGRSRDLFACPFCSAHVWVFAWSRCGSGKRCACGAMFCGSEVVAPDHDKATRRK